MERLSGNFFCTMSLHTAVILIALGGPRSLEEVGPFMASFMGRPAPPPVVTAIVDRYKLIGGRSPLPELVKTQAEALAKELGRGFQASEGFRYSRPTIIDSFGKAIKAGAERIIGLSMSPFETEVTTGVYRSAFEPLGNGKVKKTFIPSWHDSALIIDAWVEKVNAGLTRFSEAARKKAVILFTSHSIPVRYSVAGDPYQKQIEESATLVAKKAVIK